MKKDKKILLFLLLINAVLIFRLVKQQQNRIILGQGYYIGSYDFLEEKKQCTDCMLEIKGEIKPAIRKNNYIIIKQKEKIIGIFSGQEKIIKAYFPIRSFDSNSTLDFYLSDKNLQFKNFKFNIEKLSLHTRKSYSAPTIQSVLDSKNKNWYPEKIDELEQLDYEQFSYKVLLSAFSNDDRLGIAYIKQILSNTHPKRGVVMEYLKQVDPALAVFVYQEIESNMDEEKKIALTYILDAAWNWMYLHQILKQNSVSLRRKLYASGKIGIMGNHPNLVAFPRQYLETAQGMVLSDVLWAIGKSLQAKQDWKEAYPYALKHIHHPDAHVAKQAWHGISNLRQKNAYPLVRQYLDQNTQLPSVKKTQKKFCAVCMQTKDQAPSLKDNLYATIGRLHQAEHQDFLIQAFHKESNPFFKRVITDFIGNPMTEQSEQFLVKLIASDQASYLKYYALRNLYRNKHKLAKDFFVSFAKKNEDMLLSQVLKKMQEGVPAW